MYKYPSEVRRQLAKDGITGLPLKSQIFRRDFYYHDVMCDFKSTKNGFQFKVLNYRNPIQRFA